MKRVAAAGAVVLAVLAASGCGAVPESGVAAKIGDSEVSVEQLESQLLSDMRHVWKDYHSAGARQIEQPDDVIAAAKIEHRGPRFSRPASFRPLVDGAVAGARNHPAVEKETAHQTPYSYRVRWELKRRPLKFWLSGGANVG